MGKHVIIIGAGVGGLATASLLAKTGHKVTIYEKNDFPGGRAGKFQAKGFTFNYGPSWYLMSEVFDHFFELLGENVQELLAPKRLNPSFRVFFKDTLIGAVDISSEKTRDEKVFESIEPGAKQALREYKHDVKFLYDTANREFLYRNYESAKDFMSRQMVFKAMKLNMLSKYTKYTEKFFSSHELQKIVQFPTLFLGTAPDNAPAFYNLLNHSVLTEGVYYPSGGMHKIVDQLVKVAEKNNVELIYNSPIDKILVKNKLVTGVRLRSGEKIKADIVISNAPRQHSETALLAERYRSYPKRYWARRQYSPGALMIYLGVKKIYRNLEHHNLVFSKEWHKNFSDIFKKKTWPADPSFYVNNPSRSDKSLAPKGHQNIVALVPIGSNRLQPSEANNYADGVLETMERAMHLPDLRKKIVYKRLFYGADFDNTWNSFGGNALGLSHTLRQSAAFRPNNISAKVENLYFVGADTVPGIGLPMCLISAELVYKQIIGNKTASPLSYK